MLRKSLLLSVLVLAPIAAAGCAVDTVDEGVSNPAVEEDRGPIGKADLYGTCMEIDINYCGLKSSGNCWCDELCTTYGDCCDDYQAECTEPACDPTMMCGQAISCVDGQWYPTTCGPANCDEPMGPCEPEPTCDPTMMCGQAITCVEGQWYPTTCGPANCDEPMGPCEPEPEYCGGFAGLTCGDGEYCHYESGDYCGFADATGVCQDIPQICPEIYSPVCGCNGENYSSPCDANAAGTSVKQTGDCECQPGYTQQFCWGSMQCVPIGAMC